MKKIFSLLCLFALCLAAGAQPQPSWTGTFATAVEYTGEGDMPKTTTLTHHTLRQIVHVSIGGERLKVKLSNEFGDSAVEIKAVYLADALSGADIRPATAKYLTFNGKRSVTIAKGEAVWSDVLSYRLKPLQRLSVTISYGKTPRHMTSHRGSRTNSYIAQGVVGAKKRFEPVETLAHWYNLSSISVETKADSQRAGTAIAILGNSITDGRGSTTDAQNRWSDRLAEALKGETGVLNLGIGGNCVVSGGLSQPAVVRFDRDILAQEGINRVIIFEGTNDIGCCQDSQAEQTSRKLIAAYKDLAARAHAKELKVYGATITPFKGNGWYSVWHETARQVVNEWIRTAKDFDGVIDFDACVRDPQHPDRLLQDYSDDWLHLNPKGYEVMGKFAAEKLLAD